MRVVADRQAPDIPDQAGSARRQRRGGLATLIFTLSVVGVAIAAALSAPEGGFAISDAMRSLGRVIGFGGDVKVTQEGSLPENAMRDEAAQMSVDDKAQLLALGQDAQQQNAAIPVSGEPLDTARRFLLNNPASFETALKCLTQAIYYEAALEPLQGRRAVAQVVLNRMRHPAYPKSVCGVVYQGAERATGCQFSFTCDGSLLRTPMAGPWREARQVALAALAGYVETSVGTATHYHADYVLPKWAFTLGKIEQLGRHIFYRFSGNWGRSTAFTGQYSGREVVPTLNFDALEARLLAAGGGVSAEPLVPGLTVSPHVTDRHAAEDVGGRIDTTKEWRLAIPDPVAASSRYRAVVEEQPTRSAEPALAAAQMTNTVNP